VQLCFSALILAASAAAAAFASSSALMCASSAAAAEAARIKAEKQSCTHQSRSGSGCRRGSAHQGGEH
jgi:hypothetical protein